MIKACHNLSCLSQGADPCYVKLHAQTHKYTKYCPKHSYGVSEHYDQYSDESPWYSTGQGMGDMAIRWAILSHLLITAYESEAIAWIVCSVIWDILIMLRLDTFVNDTNLIYGTDGTTQFGKILMQVQANLELWHGLLQSNGGTLSPTKYSWMLFSWTTDNNGTAILDTPPIHAEIYTTNQSGTKHPLKINIPSDAIHLLGVQIAANGNQNKELQVLKQCKSCTCLQIFTCMAVLKTTTTHQKIIV